MRGKSRAFNLTLDVAACAEAGVNQPFMPQALQGLRVIVDMLTLVADISLPADAQPVEIIDQVCAVFRSATIEIDIFDA